MLKDKTSEVRQAAAWALHQTDPKAAKEAGVPVAVTVYHAFIGTSPKGFERDDVFQIASFGKGGEAVHTLVLWHDLGGQGLLTTAAI